MKRVIVAVVFVMCLITPITVYAKSTHQNRPLGNPCANVTWRQYFGPVESPFGQYDLQAELDVLEGTYTGVYCGQIRAEANDTLYYGCTTFAGAAGIGGFTDQGSGWSAYHCTATTYHFVGPLWTVSCPNIWGNYIVIDTGAQSPGGTWDNAYTPNYYC